MPAGAPAVAKRMPLCGSVNDSTCMGWWLGQHFFYSVVQRRLLCGGANNAAVA